MVVKVVPQSGYLKELKELFFDEPEKHSTVDENFQIVSNLRLCYTVTLDKSSISSLVQMTPLAWTTTKERIKSLLEVDCKALDCLLKATSAFCYIE